MVIKVKQGKGDRKFYQGGWNFIFTYLIIEEDLVNKMTFEKGSYVNESSEERLDIFLRIL